MDAQPQSLADALDHIEELRSRIAELEAHNTTQASQLGQADQAQTHRGEALQFLLARLRAKHGITGDSTDVQQLIARFREAAQAQPGAPGMAGDDDELSLSIGSADLDEAMLSLSSED